MLSLGFHDFPLPTAGDDVTSITAGPDGNVWFTAAPNLLGIDFVGYPALSGEVGRIAPDGSVTEFPLPLRVTAGSITAGPDGNLWFTENVHPASTGSPSGGTARIGRMTPSGVLTEFPVGLGSAAGLTKGPDGNLWFVTDSSLDRITTSGVVTAFPVHSVAGAGPSLAGSITTGPDGNLWFSEWSYGDSRIGRMTPEGVVTEFPLPSNLVEAQNLIAGPDGSVWFTEGYVTSGAVPKVGRINPSGVVAEFSAPTPGAFAGSITTGQDGALWFTETFAFNAATNTASPPKLVRISPAGSMTEFEVPEGFTVAPTDPGLLTLGPDGDLWLGEPGAGLANNLRGGRIGEVVLAPPVAHTPAPVLPPAPAVVGFRRHDTPGQPTQIVLTFGGDLSPSSAQNLKNYAVVSVFPGVRPVHRFGHAVPLASAVYDPAARTVTLSIRGRLKPRLHYQLTVNVASATGLADPTGVHLAGQVTGMAGGIDVAPVPSLPFRRPHRF